MIKINISRQYANFDSSKIKNIVFDLGAVLLNIDFNRSIKEFSKLGVTDYSKTLDRLRQMDVFFRFEMGLIGPYVFREEFCNCAGLKISDSQFDAAWNAVLLDFPKERVDLLLQLKKQYHLYLLSNTNIIHFDSYIKSFRDRYGFDFSDLFVKAYYSFNMRMKKPDKEIYDFVLGDSNLAPAETLFIDDLIENITGAKSAGIIGYHLKENETICDIFNAG